MTECFAFNCSHKVQWERVTQFSGTHPYCYSHARKQEDWHKKDDSDSFWRKIKPEKKVGQSMKKTLKPVKVKKEVKMSDEDKNFLILIGDIGFYAHTYVRGKCFGDGARMSALSRVIGKAEILIEWAKHLATEEAAS